MGDRGGGAHGQWGTWAMGHMSNGAHGQSGTWVKGVSCLILQIEMWHFGDGAHG